GDFDRAMGEEQEAIARSGVGSAADEVFGQAGQADPGEAAGSVGAPGAASTQPQESDEGSSGEAAARVPVEETTVSVEGCEDQDKVARQLCEAATKEQDPFLRAALWDE